MMEPRTIWNGTVSFGLVAIPVQMLSAVSEDRVAFNLLHDQTHARLERRLFCPAHNAPVHPEHIVRGFEIEPERYVLVTQEEFDSLAPERSQTIEIAEFVDEREIDPVFFDRAYYLKPGKGVEKPYHLLVSVMRKTGKMGISRFVLRNREHLCGIKAVEDVLCLFMLHFHEEQVEPDDLAPSVEARGEDVRALSAIIGKLSRPYDPGKYKNEYTIRLLEFIKRKAKEQGTVEAPPAEAGQEEEPVDLIAALEESIEKMKAGSPK